MIINNYNGYNTYMIQISDRVADTVNTVVEPNKHGWKRIISYYVVICGLFFIEYLFLTGNIFYKNS